MGQLIKLTKHPPEQAKFASKNSEGSQAEISCPVGSGWDPQLLQYSGCFSPISLLISGRFYICRRHLLTAIPDKPSAHPCSQEIFKVIDLSRPPQPKKTKADPAVKYLSRQIAKLSIALKETNDFSQQQRLSQQHKELSHILHQGYLEN